MRIENEVKLDYKDVLIRPKRSTLKSRSEVDLTREFNYRNFEPNFFESLERQHRSYIGIPIMAANMDGVGTFEMADTLSKEYIFTCLIKTYSAEELISFFRPYSFYKTNHVAMSIGTSDEDYEKLVKVYEILQENLKYVCVDVANGYSEYFVDHIRKIRSNFPHLVIIAGNVVTADQTQELILNGADIVKVGIGPGCFTPDTQVLTDNGWKYITAVKLGDKVLTHNGTWEDVTHQWNFTHHKEISNIELDNGDVYQMTPDHKVFVIHSSKENMCKTDSDILSNGMWISAKDLTDEWLVVTQ